MEILLLLGGAALLLLAAQKKGGGASVGGAAASRYITDLQERGWTGTTLPGSTSGEIYAAYRRELESLIGPILTLEDKRASYVTDLQKRGWTGTTLPGSTLDEIDSAYRRELKLFSVVLVDDYRAELVRELQSRGWTGITLAGSTYDEIHTSYIREFDLFYGIVTFSNLNTVEAKRADLVKALRFRGWTGTTLQGSTIEEVYASFSRELDILVASEASTGPKFRVGDRVIADDGRNGIISTFHWTNSTEGYWYVVENDAFTWYQESRLRAA